MCHEFESRQREEKDMADAKKPRPADDKIAAAVRDVFASNRMQAAWRMAQGSSQENRMPAVEAIFRMLEKEGLTFEDVMTAVLTIRPDPAIPANPMADAFGNWEGIFRMNPKRTAQTAPTPTPAPDPRTPPRGTKSFHAGSEIPATITGTVHIDDERPTKNGRMVVFTVHYDTEVYGPIVCFTNTGIGVLKAAAEEDGMIVMHVRPANGPGMMPTANSVRMVA
jgi:hypothetical protein